MSRAHQALMALNWALALAGVALLGLHFHAEIWPYARDVDGGILFGSGLLMLGVVTALGGALARGLSGIGPDQVLAALASAWFFHLGNEASAKVVFNMAAMPDYIAAMSAFTYAFGGPWWRKPLAPRPAATPPAWLSAVALAVLAALGAFAIVKVHEVILVDLNMHEGVTSNVLFYFPRLHANATDIGGEPFKQTWKLIVPAVYALALLAAARKLLKPDAMSERATWAWLFAFALAGKWAASYLSSQGLDIIGIKVASVNTNYYKLAQAVDAQGIYSYIKDHHLKQFTLGAHGDTHPFGPVLFYWLLSKVLGWRPLLHGLAFQAVTAVTVIYIYRLGRLVYGSRNAGLAAAFIYLSSPLSLILSGAGIDALVALALAVMLYELGRSIDEGSAKHAAFAGLAAFAGSLISFGSSSVLAFAGLWAAVMARRRNEGVAKPLLALGRSFGLLLATMLLAHVALKALTGWHYSYLDGLRGAHFVHRNANLWRFYELWSWGNVALFAGYAGAGLVAAWFARSFAAVWRADQEDEFSIPALAFVLFLVLAAMGRGEVQREFLFGGIFMALPAGRFLCRKGPDGGLVSPWALLSFAVLLNLASMVVLQIVALDFW